MTILDAIIILIILVGAVSGFKKGAIRSLVALVGTVLLVVVSFYLKNPVANFLMEHAPFLNFSGKWEGLVTLNILLYEAISYLLVFVCLSTILNIFLKISGIIEKILNATIILGIPSKIIGAVLGFIEAVVFSFIVLFALLQFNTTHEMVLNSSLSRSILNKTPFIGNMIDDSYQAITDINGIKDKYNDNTNIGDYNNEILQIMLKYEVITKDEIQKLIDSGKLNYDGIDQFKEEENYG